MDIMSLADVVGVSTPEAFLDIPIGLLLIGDKEKIKFLYYVEDKENGQKVKLHFDGAKFLRLLICSLMMALSAMISRIVSPDLPVSLLVTVAAYILIIKCAYSLTWLKSFLCVLFFTSTLILIETLYIPEIMVAMRHSLNNIFSDSLLRISYSVPERIIQLVIVIILQSLKAVLVNVRKFKPISRDSILTITLQIVFMVL